jgi:hypothetical protein
LKSFTCVLLTYEYLLTYSMEQSPSWEANQFAASQKIPCILWNPKVHYRIYLSLSWASWIQSIPPHPTFWRSILILSSHLHLGLHSIYLYLEFITFWACQTSYVKNHDTLCSEALLENHGVPPLVNQLTEFYETRRFITVFTTTRHLSQSWARSIQFTPSQPISILSMLRIYNNREITHHISGIESVPCLRLKVG